MSFKNVRTEMKFKNAEDVVAGMDALLNKRASLGSENLARLVDVRGLAKVKQALAKAGDKQSVDLLRDIQLELLDRLGVDDSTERAINRLAQVARDGQRWDVALVRNNVFKVANELGIKLPSGMFASERQASAKITPEQYDKLKSGKRIWLGVDTMWASPKGETEFEVGPTTYSKKYDVYSKALYPIGEDGKPIKQGRAKWTLFKRTSGVSLAHGNMGTVLKSFRMASEDKTAATSTIFAYDRASDIELIFDPWQRSVEIGMGGEWWGGPVKMGKNVYVHRKERVDEAYKPVTVNVEKLGHGLRFAVMGGFGGGHTFVLGFKGM
jgi:hypothetical protein